MNGLTSGHTSRSPCRRLKFGGAHVRHVEPVGHGAYIYICGLEYLVDIIGDHGGMTVSETSCTLNL